MPKCTRCQEAVAAQAERCPKCGAWLGQLEDSPASSPGSPDDAIRRLLSQGQKIGAIKLYRQQTGAGLAEAKAAVERMERGEPAPDQRCIADGSDQQLLELMASGQKIAAIKLLRDQTGLGLKDAKDAVEALAARHGIVTPARSGCLGVLALVLLASSLLVAGLLIWLGR